MKEKLMNNKASISKLMTEIFLVCGMIAGPLFTIAWIIEGATRVDYNPIRHPISSLSIGSLGWTQVVNFEITGLLVVLFAFAVWRMFRIQRVTAWGSLLIGIIGIGLIGAGIFIADPLNGYPLNTLDNSVSTIHGMYHNLFSLFVFIGLPVACFVFSRYFARLRLIRWVKFSLITGIICTFLFSLTMAGFMQIPWFKDLAGLLQRITLTIGWTWLTLLAAQLKKTL